MTSDTASPHFMADLVSQLLLNASQIILGLYSAEENESELACAFDLHLHRTPEQFWLEGTLKIT